MTRVSRAMLPCGHRIFAFPRLGFGLNSKQQIVLVRSNKISVVLSVSVTSG